MEFIIPVFLNCSTCFGQNTAHYQELKNVIAASGFTYLFGCRLPLRWLSHRSGNRPPQTYVKPEAAIRVFELLMMGNVSSETCWTIKKHWNNKFYFTVASYWFFLWVLYYDARIREHQTILYVRENDSFMEFRTSLNCKNVTFRKTTDMLCIYWFSS